MARPSIHDRSSTAPPTPSGVNHGKTRSACNRCHQQKLRCIKMKEQSNCERCTKLKVECRHSPRERRIVRNKLSRPEPRDLAPAIAPAMPDMQQILTLVPGSIGRDWFSFITTGSDNAEGRGYLNSDPRFPTQIDPARNLATGLDQSAQLAGCLRTHTLNHNDGAALQIVPGHQYIMSEVENNHSFGLLDTSEIGGYTNSPSRGLGRPFTSTTGRLSSLSMALYECASKLPSINASRAEPVGSINISYTMNSSTRESVLLALDEVFCITNEFINLMKSLCLTTGCHEPPIVIASSSTTETSRHLAQGMNTAILHHVAPHVLTSLPDFSPQPTAIECFHESEISSSVIQPFSHLDEATMLLFLSCHCRLAEIYECIFQAIQKCIEGSYAASHSTAGIILPQLQVGGFGGISCPALRVDFNGPPLPPATVSMYLVLTTTLSSQLWAQVRETMRRGIGHNGSRNLAPVAHLEVADPMWDIAMDRTDNVSRTIEAIRNFL